MFDKHSSLPSLYEITYNKTKNNLSSTSAYYHAYAEKRYVDNKQKFIKFTNLFLKKIPETLSYYIKLQRLLDHNDPVGAQNYFAMDIDKITNICLSDPFHDNIIMRIANASKIEFEHIINEFHELCVNQEYLLSKFNCQNCYFLSELLEHAINIQEKESSVLPFGDISSLQEAMAFLLLNHGCSRNFVKELFNFHYTCKFIKNAKIQVTSQRRTKRMHLLCMRHDDKALYIMMMINLYLMAVRISKHEILSDNFLDIEALRDGIKIALAIGSYFSTFMIYQAYQKQSLNELFEIFPRFEEFYEILKLLLAGKAYVLACEECGTCYLKFDSSILTNNSYNRIKYLKCPSCKNTSSFKLN